MSKTAVKSPNRPKVTVTLPAHLVEKVDALAAGADMSRSAVITAALREYFREEQ